MLNTTMTMFDLPNPACAKLGYCADFCGLCEPKFERSLFNTENGARELTEHSLFGECRVKGKCVCDICRFMADNDNGKNYEEEILKPVGKRLLPSPRNEVNRVW